MYLCSSEKNKMNESEVHIGEIVDLTTICLSFPEIALGSDDATMDFCIPRDNIITTIDKMFDTGVQVIGVEGEEGIGRTTLFAQYARKKSNNTFSLFIKPSTKWGFDPLMLQYDICNQLNWFFYKERIDNLDVANDTFLRNHLLKLQQYSRIYKQTFIFVVDGLEDIPQEAQESREIILDILPFGMPNFKFLIAADPNILPERKRKGLLCKSFPLVGFNYDEVEKFFSEIPIEKDDLEEIYSTCNGIPGKLSSIKRILKSGVDIKTFVNDMPNKIPNLFELEWDNVHNKGESLEKILAILAHDNNILNIQFITGVCNKNETEVLEMLRKISFISIDPESKEVSFVSNGFKNFVKEKLSHYKDEVNKLIVDYLINKPESEEKLKLLPWYLDKSGKYNEIIHYLSPERFEDIIERIPSINMIDQMINLGLNASDQLSRDGDIIRYGLYKSILRELNGIETWRSEIEALMAIKDYDSALTLTQATVLKEDRLHLLAIIARMKKEHGLMPEPELIDQIRDLYKQIDILSLKDKVVDIAIDLMFAVPDIAIELVEKANNTDLSENSIDWAFAKMAIAAVADDKKYVRTDIFESLNNKISNPILKRLSAGIKLLLGKYSACDVIAEVDKLENTADRLYLLCQWVISHKEHQDALKVIDYALNILLKTATYAPNAKIFKDLSSALPFMDDHEKTKHIIYILDSQKQNIQHSGPTEDYVKLQLLLAESESKYDFSTASNRMIDLYLYIDCNIVELDIKTNCLAMYVCALQKIDPKMQLEKSDNLHSMANDDFESNLSQLLNSTADHYEITKLIIKSLSKLEHNRAFELAKSLNIERSRDLACIELIESYIKLPLEKIDLKFIENVLSNITDKDIKSIALVKFIERLSGDSNTNAEKINESLSLINQVNSVTSLSERCRAYCLLYSTLKNNNISEFHSLEEQLLHLLRSSWEGIDMSWERINVGFKIVEVLADHSLGIAKEYFKITKKLRNTVIFDSYSNARTFITCVRLAIRAYSGLLPKGINTEHDYDRISMLIQSIPSSCEQVKMWSIMGLYCYINDKITEFYKIYNQCVKPLLDTLPEDDVNSINYIKCIIAPTLYLAHKRTAFDTLLTIPLPDRDIAYFNICNFILKMIIPHDPYDDFINSRKDIKYSDLQDVCEILEYIEDDCILYSIISDIADCMADNKALFTREQRDYIAAQLVKIIENQLPNLKFIKHDGYKIISLAQAYRISKRQREDWENLITVAYTIPNIADRAYVLSVLASVNNLPISRRKDLLKDARKCIDTIPSLIERIVHLEWFSLLAWNVDSGFCKECLTTALKSSIECDDKNIFSIQRRIIDLAYRLDPDLSSSLASIADDDKARIEMKKNIKRHHELLKIKKNIIDQKGSSDTVKPSDYIKISWMLLKSLNAGRVNPIHHQQSREYIIKTCGLSLIECYPVFAWTIQNAIIRLSYTDQSSTIIRPMFEATLVGAELAQKITIKATKQNKQTLSFLSKQVNDKSVLIRAGERDYALKYIINWLEKNLKDYLLICDPYFGLNDLDILKYICTIKNDCQVSILTSIKHLENEKIEEPWDKSFKRHWCMRISDQDPPYTFIYVIGTQSQGNSPFHDRWWITNGSGLRIGTSLNSLGLSKSSEISVLSENEAYIINKEVIQYINGTKREYNGEKLKYIVFTLN